MILKRVGVCQGMKSKILVLGCNGMLGHMVSLYLKEKGYDVTGFAKKDLRLIDTIIGDARDLKSLRSIVLNGNYDWVINCIGILNKACDEHPSNAILLNSYLPHFLAEITANLKTKIIHISTDCVFSGSKGSYTVNDTKDASSIYGISKGLGEINDSKNVTLRTSIIGPDINKNGIGLFNWFVHQKGSVNGFTNVFWNGVTTLELAKVIEKVIINDLSGFFNVTPSEKVSKYELLCLLKDFNNIDIIPVDEPKNDKTLVNNFVYSISSYRKMIDELKEWISSHNIYEEVKDE